MTVVHHLSRTQLWELEHELRRECARLERSFMMPMGTEEAVQPKRGGPEVTSQVEKALATALETRMLERHQVLVSALRRFETGTYGVCVGCDNPIPYGRLLAMPEAAYCIGCKGGA